MDIKKLKNLLMLSMSGIIVCIIIGFILAGLNAITPGKFAFQFTLYGIFGSLLYSVLKFTTKRDFLFVTILFILFDTILLGGGTLSKAIIHGIYAILFAGAIWIHVTITPNENKSFDLSNIFSLAGIVAVSFILIVLILNIFPNYQFEYSFLEGQTFIGLLIGLGLGIGFRIYYRYLKTI